MTPIPLLTQILAAIKGTLPETMPPPVRNPDGSVSTVRTISYGTDQGEVLIPTVINGRVVSDEEAIKHSRRTGEHFGIFKSIKDATAYGQNLHERHQRELKNRK